MSIYNKYYIRSHYKGDSKLNYYYSEDEEGAFVSVSSIEDALVFYSINLAYSKFPKIKETLVNEVISIPIKYKKSLDILI